MARKTIRVVQCDGCGLREEAPDDWRGTNPPIPTGWLEMWEPHGEPGDREKHACGICKQRVLKALTNRCA